MGRKEEMIKKIMKLMGQAEKIRNIDIAAHIDHGKTTLSDNLIAGAGMMSEELAGKQLMLDFDEQEQARGITINAANASMVHPFEKDEYLINLIDTPGHVDFGGDVTRAMRAVDGCIVVVCAVEGVMPQTETVVRQALKERVKPVLFINKVDRLINELKVTPEQMQQRFIKIITEVNRLIKKSLPDDWKEDWSLKVEDGSVAFGSAYHNWAISIPYMKKSNITFKEIYDYCEREEQKALAKKAPVHEILLDMVVKHLPSPTTAQKYRIPQIWRGDMESEIGKDMITCNRDGKLGVMVTKIILDPHAGEVAIGRIYSGKVKRGQEVYIVGTPKKYRIQNVGVSFGGERLPVEEVSAGNIVALGGLRDAMAGSTITDEPDVDPFEEMKHVSEPVVTKAIEAKHMKDLPKLIDILRSISKADPSIVVEINQETGEHLISGMGELHLEITEYRIVNEHNVEIIASKPIVVYRESVARTGLEFEGKSPNRHNRFYIIVEPLPENIVEALRNGVITPIMLKKEKSTYKKFEELGMNREMAKGIFSIDKTSIFTNMTKGVQYLNEVRELMIEAFKEVVKKGPLSWENSSGLLVKLMDVKLHEDSIHRGPAQVIPAVRSAIYGSMLTADPMLLEPMQKVYVTVPFEVMGAVNREFAQRRGTILDMSQEGDTTTVIATVPVAEMFGFAGAIRGATGGRVLWSTEHAGFERVPRELQHDIIRDIRTRKGMKPEPPRPEDYSA